MTKTQWAQLILGLGGAVVTVILIASIPSIDTESLWLMVSNLLLSVNAGAGPARQAIRSRKDAKLAKDKR